MTKNYLRFEDVKLINSYAEGILTVIMLYNDYFSFYKQFIYEQIKISQDGVDGFELSYAAFSEFPFDNKGCLEDLISESKICQVHNKYYIQNEK